MFEFSVLSCIVTSSPFRYSIFACRILLTADREAKHDHRSRRGSSARYLLNPGHWVQHRPPVWQFSSTRPRVHSHFARGRPFSLRYFDRSHSGPCVKDSVDSVGRITQCRGHFGRVRFRGFWSRAPRLSADDRAGAFCFAQNSGTTRMVVELEFDRGVDVRFFFSVQHAAACPVTAWTFWLLENGWSSGRCNRSSRAVPRWRKDGSHD